MNKHKLTQHARERIYERTYVTEEMVLTALDDGKFWPLGKDVNSNRSHELLFISDDEGWFVVVRDIKTMEVVTFLPVDYHNKWRISFEALEKSRQISKDTVAGPEGPSVFRITVVCLTEKMGSKRFDLGSWPINNLENVIELMDDEDFINQMCLRMEDKGHSCLDIISFEVQKGNKGEYHNLPEDVLIERMESV